MRPEGNSLDLNNLPEEHGKQPVEESSTTTAASADTTRFKKKKKKKKKTKKKNSAGKEEAGKVYECRFCSLKFCKSQALGGHMNRHRQERETETLTRARQLVFGNEGLAGAGAIGDLSLGGFRQRGGGIGEAPCLRFQQVYPSIPTRPSNPPPWQQYLHRPPHPPVRNYYIGHVVSGSAERLPSFICAHRYQDR